METPRAEFPFEQVVVDLCYLAGHSYVVYADRYSGWIEVEQIPSTAFHYLKPLLLRWFAAYGAPTEVSSDGGPPFNSYEYNTLLKEWDIRKRQSSAYYAQSNGRAEAAVKSIKRLLLGNIDSCTGKIDTGDAARAILTHRNTPASDTGLSPAMALFGRPIRDHLPQAFSQPLSMEWQRIADARDAALAKRHIMHSTGRDLKPLGVGDSVQIQSQTGSRPTKWLNTGIIAEVLPNRQYKVVTDGSRRVALRNRKHLKKILPICRMEQLPDPILQDSPPAPITAYPSPQPVSQQPQSPSPPLLSQRGFCHNPAVPRNEDTRPIGNSEWTTPTNPQKQPPPSFQRRLEFNEDTSQPDTPSDPPLLRRSSRIRNPPKIFSPKTHGPSHMTPSSD